MTKVSIIIPVWNLWHMTLQCLESIATTCAADISQNNVEVIVVDNNSTDETATALDGTITRLFGENGKAIRNSENLGFAKACNAGAKAAAHPLLFFLNNDTVLTQSWLPPLVQALESTPKLGAVGPLLLYPNNTVQHCGICFCPLLYAHHIYENFPPTHSVLSKPRISQAITGAAMLISAALFIKCGMFHEEYINGCEDIDLCLTLHKQGFDCKSIPKSRIYHLTSQTPGRFDNETHNAKLLRKRHPHMKPDLHTVVTEDGFVPTFGPQLDLIINLPEAKAKALDVIFSANFDLQKCQEKLKSEPFWFGGYELMANYYEQQAQWVDALEMWLHFTNISPSSGHFIHMRRIIEHIEDENIQHEVQHMMKKFESDSAQTNTWLKHSTAIKNWATQNNDKTLKSMIDDWLKTYNPHR